MNFEIWINVIIGFGIPTLVTLILSLLIKEKIILSSLLKEKNEK